MGYYFHESGRRPYGTDTSWQRHDHARRASSNTAIAALSKEFGINPKTVAKWRKRQTVEDQKTGGGIEEPLIDALGR